MDTQKKATLFALLAIFFWSTVATAFKIALRSINFMHLLLYVGVISCLILFIIMVFENKLHLIKQITLRQIFSSLLISLLNPFLYYLFVFKSYAVLQAQIAQPLNYTWPVMLVILSVPLLKHKLTWLSFTAILISFSGVFFIASSGNLSDYQITEPLGVSLAIGSSVIWALFWIFNVRDKRDETLKLFLNFLFGSIYTLLFCFAVGNPPVLPEAKDSLVLVYIGLFEMGITFLLWMKAMQWTKSTAKIGNYVFLSPFISLIFLHYIIGEDIYYTTIIGLILIVSGIIIQKVYATD